MSEMTIYDELLAATKVKPRGSESPQALAKRLIGAVDKLDDDAWNEMSEETQVWVNEGIAAIEAGAEITLPPGMEGPDDEEGVDPGAAEEEPAADEEEEAEEEEEVEEVEEVAAAHNGRGKTRAPARKNAPKRTAAKKATAKESATKESAPKRAPAKKKTVRGDGVEFVSKLGLRGKYVQIEEAARAGKMPPVPDFSAETHKYWRPKLDEVVKMARAGDVKGLKKYSIVPRSTSPKAIDRYRRLAIVALEAKN